MRILCPNKIAALIQDVDCESLYGQGIRALLLDVDNTLVPWDQDAIDSAVIQWIEAAKATGLDVYLVSNGRQRRVIRFAERLQVPGRARALKPFPMSFRRSLHGTPWEPTQVAVIGDQVFTDVLGGNLLGYFTVLVDPLSKQEFAGTKLVRWLEKALLYWFSRSGRVDPLNIKRRYCR